MSVTVGEIDRWVREELSTEEWEAIDNGLNGIQVGALDRQVKKVATAVDASLETFKRAVERGADLLFVHHGLFWGKPEPLTGAHYERVRFLGEHGLALCAVHLPLDQHPKWGNGVGLAHALGLGRIEPFGIYRGKKVGYKGVLERPLSLEEVERKLFGETIQNLPCRILSFGPRRVVSVGIVSGGGARCVDDAISEGLDLFVTGESSHSIYHLSQEARINVLFGGHYQTETIGVARVGQELEKVFDIEAFFIDVPTGY